VYAICGFYYFITFI